MLLVTYCNKEWKYCQVTLNVLKVLKVRVKVAIVSYIFIYIVIFLMISNGGDDNCCTFAAKMKTFVKI